MIIFVLYMYLHERNSFKHFFKPFFGKNDKIIIESTDSINIILSWITIDSSKIILDIVGIKY